ncbi:MAG: DUF6075 family protein [[Eubacterium] siraeum]
MGIAQNEGKHQPDVQFQEDCIEPEGMHGGWQTSGTVKVCHLALTLERVCRGRAERYFTPDECSRCEFAPTYGGYQGQIPRILGSFLLPENRQKFQDKKGKTYEEL